MHAHTIQRLRTWLPESRDTAIVDLGCGDGTLVRTLAADGYIRVSGLDRNWQEDDPLIQRRDLRAWLSERPQTDVIIAWDVLEHLPVQDLQWTLAQIRLALTPGGRLIVHAPNAEGLFGSRIFFSDVTHQWAFTPKLAHDLCTQAGFQTVHVLEDNPIVHGPVSLCRWVLWKIVTIVGRLLLAVETGETGGILSQNLIVIAEV